MKHVRSFVAALAFAVVCACNSNSTTSTPAVVATASAAPSAVTLAAGSAPASAALGTLNGTAVTLALPPASSGATTLSAQLTSAVASPLPALSSALRSTSAVGTSAALAYITLSAAAPVTFAATPTLTFTLPSAPTGSYALAFYDATQPALGWQPLFGGAGAVSGNTITFVAAPKTLVFASNAPSVIALYQPTATATASPNAALSGQVAGSPISHVIVVVQENRTFDNLFGLSGLTGGAAAYPGADAANTIGGQKMRVGSFTEPYDPSHSHASLVAEWDNGKMDGFATVPVSSALGGATPPPGYAFMNVAPSETLAYHLLASRYAVADRMFSSRLVPSFPGHQFLIAGQGPADNPTDNAIWGCDSKAGSTALQFASAEAVTSPGAAPCYDYQTLGDLLDAKGVSWKYYTGSIGSLDGLNSAYDAINHIRNGADWTRNIVSPVTQILSDVQACSLPAVSYVTPPSLASDHAGSFTAAGPGWVGSIYLQIAQSLAFAPTNPGCQYYTNTAILVTWDDAGGWYDHVVPPVDPQGNSWGFRVPLIVASAFARSGYSATNANAPPYVSHTNREFGSILKFIEKNWNLGSLGTRDAGADDLSDMFNYTQAAPIPPIGAALQSAMRHPASYYRNLPAPTRPVDDDK